MPAMEEITGVLKDNGLYQDVFLCFAPNLLQSPYLVDYALADNTLYIIGAVFSRIRRPPRIFASAAARSEGVFLQMAGEKELSHLPTPRFCGGWAICRTIPCPAGARPGGCFTRSLSGVLAGERAQEITSGLRRSWGSSSCRNSWSGCAACAGENEGWTRSSNSLNSSQPINRRKTRWETGSPTG